MCESRLCQRFVDGKVCRATFGLEFKTVDVDLGPGHQLEAHGADEDVIRTRPAPPCRSHCRCVLHNGDAPGWKIKSLLERPLKKSTQGRHQFRFWPVGHFLVDWRQDSRRLLGEKKLAPLAAKPANLALSEE